MEIFPGPISQDICNTTLTYEVGICEDTGIILCPLLELFLMNTILSDGWRSIALCLSFLEGEQALLCGGGGGGEISEDAEIFPRPL